ncbi:glycoside hydrolase family 3 protein [Sphingobacterium spiritivorum]|uniref:glycoside hydrolase family 3 protein n=1 Tax=Sphingobacterium spiritivorum TaxID=258 RepID=UPI003DA59987
MIFRKMVLGLAFVAVSLAAKAQSNPNFVAFINQKHAWVDSVFNTLSPKEKIGQLFLVRAHTNLGQKYIDSVAAVIQKEQLGGLVVFQGGPVRHANMFNRYQAIAKVPLLMTFDGEWGLGMRMPDSTISYPYQMTLGAIQDESLIYQMGKEVAKDFHRIGMHFNFAPVVDINNNPKNPVINFRSFGDNKYNVVKKAKAYMDGMVDGGIIASLKHFPGHGDTDVDSHHDLPQLKFSKERLDTLEMYPFRQLIKDGAPAVMVAHMNIPSLDPTPNMPSSISKPVVTGLLRDQLGFKGLTVTDAMDMSGVKKFFPNGEADVQAIIAGHDLLEVSENSGRAIGLIEKAIKDGRIKQADLDARVKKVLAAKLWVGLNRKRVISTNYLYDDLNRTSSKQLVQRLADASITLLNSNNRLYSFQPKQKTAIVSIGVIAAQDFEKEMKARLPESDIYYIKGDEKEEALQEIFKNAKGHKQLIVAIHDDRSRPRSEVPFSPEVKEVIAKLAKRKAITCLFTNPYALADLPGVEKSQSILMGYQNDWFMQRAAVRAIFREIKPKGKLPVTINENYKYGTGI